jgi:hypothetical protein
VEKIEVDKVVDPGEAGKRLLIAKVLGILQKVMPSEVDIE